MLSYCVVFYYFVEFVAWSYTEIRFEGNHIRLGGFFGCHPSLLPSYFLLPFSWEPCGRPLDKNLVAYIQIKRFYKEFRNTRFWVVVRSSSDVDFFSVWR